jgi:hypothetical protein
MKTSINLPPELLEKVRKHNEEHQDIPINVSGVCRLALEATLEAKKTYYTRK